MPNSSRSAEASSKTRQVKVSAWSSAADSLNADQETMSSLEVEDDGYEQIHFTSKKSEGDTGVSDTSNCTSDSDSFVESDSESGGAPVPDERFDYEDEYNYPYEMDQMRTINISDDDFERLFADITSREHEDGNFSNLSKLSMLNSHISWLAMPHVEYLKTGYPSSSFDASDDALSCGSPDGYILCLRGGKGDRRKRIPFLLDHAYLSPLDNISDMGAKHETDI